MTGTRADQPLNVRLGSRRTPSCSSSTPMIWRCRIRRTTPAARFDNKLITSATVMVPCPWFGEVAEYAKRIPTPIWACI